MRVDVVTSGDPTPLSFDLRDSTQICELLCRIGMSRCIPSWRLRLVRSDNVLPRDASLAQLELRDGDLLTLVVKPASSFVLLGTAGGFVELWDIDDCNMIRTFVGHLTDGSGILSMYINAVAFSQNGILALTGSNDGTARLWSTESGDCMHCFDSKLRWPYSSHPVSVTSVGFVVNGEFRNTVVTGNDDGSIMLWSMDDMGKLLRTAWPHVDNPSPFKYVTVAMLSHDGSYAFSAVHCDSRLKMWSVSSGICVKYFAHDCDSIDGAVLSSDGDTLLTVGSDGITMLCDVSSGDCIRTLGEIGSWTICAVLSRDGKFVIGVGCRGHEEIAVLRQACTGEVSRRLQDPSGAVLCVALSSDSQFALTGGSGGRVRIWNTISGDCAEVLRSSV